MSTPAGWYPDGQGSQRWWDGNQWTEHTMPATPQAPPASAPAVNYNPSLTGNWTSWKAQLA